MINNIEYEADDILGMIAKFASEKNMDMIIISADRDLYQLINDTTFIYSIRNKELIDRDRLINRYRLTPEQWIDMKILVGDTGDNIPGVKGIGEIGALRLLKEFKTVDNIYAKLPQVLPSLQVKLENSKHNIPLIRTLVTIVTDYTKINLGERMLCRTQPMTTELFELLDYLELSELHNIMKYTLIREDSNDKGKITSNN